MPTARARAEWAARVRAEYGSASIAAQVAHWMIVCGLPEGLLRAALQIASDELDHARDAHAVLVAIGGEDEPVDVALADLRAEVAPEGIGASLLDAVLGTFCVGETVAVPLFAAMRADARHADARAALDRVLRDEARHRAFGWDALDALIALDPVGVRQRAPTVLPAILDGYLAAYAAEVPHPPLTDDERAVGLLDAASYARIVRRALREDVGPRFAARGIAVAPTAG